MTAEPASTGLRAVTRVLDVLDALQEAPGGLPLRDIARASGMAKSTTLRYLTALDERRYVERDPTTGNYHLGLGLPSQTVLHERMREKVRPSLERLRDRFDETITLGVLEGDRTTLLEIAESRQPIRLGADRGTRSYLHSTANGKAIASTLPTEVVEHVIKSRGLPARTPHTITDPKRLFEELALIRERGYSRTHEENNVGTFGVSVPVPVAKPRAALGLSAPTMRFREEFVPEIVAALQDEAARIAAELEAWHG